MFIDYDRATTFDISEHPPRIAVLGIGALEQHSLHLPISVDYDIASALSRSTAEKLSAFLLPALPYSDSMVHRGFPGTVYLRPSMTLPNHWAAGELRFASSLTATAGTSF